MTADPLHELDADLAEQREFMATRAPAYATLLELMPRALDADARARLREAWRERAFGPPYERPLLLLAALKYDALTEGEAHPLWSTLAADEPRPARLVELSAALGADRERAWQALATRYVQTNETSRAVVWLWPAHLLAGVDAGCCIDLFDLGASAGLNLVADRLPSIWQHPDGAAFRLEPLPSIRRRVGFDLRPLDVRGDEDARWLAACVWTGQGERAARLAASIAAFRAAPAAVEQATAEEMPRRLPRAGIEGPRAIAYQSIFRGYLEADERRAYHDGMWHWLAGSPGRALWTELEVRKAFKDGAPPAAITAHLVDASGARRSLVLALCEPHPCVMHVDASAVRELQSALSS